MSSCQMAAPAAGRISIKTIDYEPGKVQRRAALRMAMLVRRTEKRDACRRRIHLTDVMNHAATPHGRSSVETTTSLQSSTLSSFVFPGALFGGFNGVGGEQQQQQPMQDVRCFELWKQLQRLLLNSTSKSEAETISTTFSSSPSASAGIGTEAEVLALWREFQQEPLLSRKRVFRDNASELQVVLVRVFSDSILRTPCGNDIATSIARHAEWEAQTWRMNLFANLIQEMHTQSQVLLPNVNSVVPTTTPTPDHCHIASARQLCGVGNHDDDVEDDVEDDDDDEDALFEESDDEEEDEVQWVLSTVDTQMLFKTCGELLRRAIHIPRSTVAAVMRVCDGLWRLPRRIIEDFLVAALSINEAFQLCTFFAGQVTTPLTSDYNELMDIVGHGMALLRDALTYTCRTLDTNDAEWLRPLVAFCVAHPSHSLCQSNAVSLLINLRDLCHPSTSASVLLTQEWVPLLCQLSNSCGDSRIVCWSVITNAWHLINDLLRQHRDAFLTEGTLVAHCLQHVLYTTTWLQSITDVATFCDVETNTIQLQARLAPLEITNRLMIALPVDAVDGDNDKGARHAGQLVMQGIDVSFVINLQKGIMVAWMLQQAMESRLLFNNQNNTIINLNATESLMRRALPWMSSYQDEMLNILFELLQSMPRKQLVPLVTPQLFSFCAEFLTRLHQASELVFIHELKERTDIKLAYTQDASASSNISINSTTPLTFDVRCEALTSIIVSVLEIVGALLHLPIPIEWWQQSQLFAQCHRITTLLIHAQEQLGDVCGETMWNQTRRLYQGYASSYGTTELERCTQLRMADLPSIVLQPISHEDDDDDDEDDDDDDQVEDVDDEEDEEDDDCMN